MNLETRMKEIADACREIVAGGDKCSMGGGDAITCMNDLIAQARNIVGLTTIPDSLVGEQDDAP